MHQFISTADRILTGVCIVLTIAFIVWSYFRTFKPEEGRRRYWVLAGILILFLQLLHVVSFIK